MHAIVTAHSPGGPTLRLVELADPVPGPTEILVRVRAAGLNRADLRRSQQHFASPTDAPDVAGLEMAGEVVGVGAEVDDFRVGDRVMGMTKGCYAELTTIDARLAMPVPDEVDWVPAAALPVWFMTAHDALVTAGRFTAGGSVLIQGASSGIGLATLAVAKLLRANRVLGTSTSRTKLDRLLALGLDEGILMGEEDVGQAVRAATDARGVDVVVDMIGGGQLAASVSACAIGGRIVTVGRLGGFTDTIDLDQIALKRLHLVGVTFRTRSLAEKRAVIEAMMRDLWPALAERRLEPIVDRVFPLEAAFDAQEFMKTNNHLGKLVLRV
jgi:putative PIG3 family NAD(P)H quinone oxidoreductase